jgi:flagellar biosynthesis/type III secretory pathway protein FliH
MRLVSSVPPPAVAQVEVGEPPAPPYPDLRGENETLRVQLAALTSAVAQIRRAILAASEADLVRLACAIAERIVRRELTVDPALAVTWARDAADALTATDDLCLAVSPDLAAVVDEGAFRKAISNLATIEVDATLGPMCCEVRTPVARVDASLDERLATVAEVLGASHE